MYDPGACPAVAEDGVTTIHGEVYQVNARTWAVLEGYPDFYDRVLIGTPYGQAWMYVVDKGRHYPVVADGIWLERR